MKREWMRKFLPLALAAIAASGCDGTSPPDDPWADFDPQAVMMAAEDVLAPAAASQQAATALEDAAPALGTMGVEFAPEAVTRTLRHGGMTALARTVGFRTLVTIPAELQGSTFVYDPSTAEWHVDESRTGAPANGVRVVYYATDVAGDFVLPLSERGYIDLTDEDTSTASRLGVLIVRTAGGSNVTLADYTQGHSERETTSAFVSRVEAEGFFSDGTDRVDFTLVAVDSLDNATEDWHVSFAMGFEGAETQYDWELDAVEDVAGDYVEDWRITVARGAEVTALDLNFTGSSATQTDDASGTLRHRNVVLADIALDATGQNFVFTKPAGGSFTQQEQQTLQELMFTLILSGLGIFSYLPLLFV